MILISHPRSGSDWFLRGLLQYDYARTEIFSPLNDVQNSPFKSMSLGAKISFIKGMTGFRCQKIHSVHLHDVCMRGGTELLVHLKERTDLYLLKRRNLRKAIVSMIIATLNGNNFHGAPRQLITRAACPYELFLEINASMDTSFAERHLQFKECFIFEELLNGARPQTLQWDPRKSDVVQRSSMNFAHLIANYSEVLRWMDQHAVPGEPHATIHP